MKRCNVTAHAIEQFIRRWAPDAKAWQAEEEIQRLFSTSKNAGKTRLGDTVVVSSHRPEVRLVIKDRDVCVTVLPPGDEQNVDEDEMEEMLLAYERQQQSGKKDIFDTIATLEREAQALDRGIEKLKGVPRRDTEERIAILLKNKEHIMDKIRSLRARGGTR